MPTKNEELEELKQRIMANPFVDRVRLEMRADEGAFKELCSLLEQLAGELKGAVAIDKELALILYSMPLMIRNSYLSLGERNGPQSELVAFLEDAWIELDRLVTECLVDG